MENDEPEYQSFLNPNVKSGNDINISNYFKEATHKSIPKKILPKKTVNDIMKSFFSRDEFPSWNKLKILLDDFSNYLLYSTVELKKYTKQLQNRDDDTINILILGAGPTGLYIATYLAYINLLTPKINILLIDNRIASEGYRLPYSRNRIFGLDLSLLNTFFPQFPCVQELIKQGGIEIKYLENIMYVLACGYGVPIYFTNKISNQYKLQKFIVENKIDIVYDCTGNRLKNNFIKPNTFNESVFFPKNIILVNDQYKIICEHNNCKLVWKNNIKNRFYLSMEVYNPKGKFIKTEIFSDPLVYAHDVALFSKFHNKFLMIKKNKIINALKIFDNMSDLNLSKKIQAILLENKNYFIKFAIIEAVFYHKITISTIIDQPNQKTLYIGAGDTIFSSHFGVGAGLNRLLVFIDYIVWYTQALASF